VPTGPDADDIDSRREDEVEEEGEERELGVRRGVKEGRAATPSTAGREAAVSEEEERTPGASI
jgi:hypothetical protein